MNAIEGDDALYAERDRLVRELVESRAHLKVVVAGPGTGKTRAFKELLGARGGNKIALTFINNLVLGLQRDLADLAIAQTLHGFARALLHGHGAHGVSQGCDYYPSLTDILSADATIVLGQEVGYWDVEGVLHEMQESDVLDSAMASGTYYDAVGHTDSVYRVVQHLRANPDDVPRFEQVVVDEYQDFSLLEVNLIGELSALSPTLVVGDDDQALYEFKHARADYLRDVAANDAYARFELPFCSRCPEVLVEGVHRVVGQARRSGLLTGRVEKRYECFAPTKRADSERYPRIIHADCSVERNNAPYICRYVAEQIAAIPPEDVTASAEGDYPTALVMGPPQFSSRVAAYLLELGVPNVTPPRSSRRELDILDAYRRLARQPRSRLGWRILLHLVDCGGRDEIVHRALRGEEIAELLPAAYREQHLAVATLVAKVRANEDLDDDERVKLEMAIGCPLDEARRLLGVAEEDVEVVPTVEGAPTVAITTLEGAKGLQAAHVFVVGANDRHFPRVNAEPNDHEVCCMLVALTRATKRCYLVSCKRFGGIAVRPSVFISWLGDLIEPLGVDANYFARSAARREA
jgi:hypothetical protein